MLTGPGGWASPDARAAAPRPRPPRPGPARCARRPPGVGRHGEAARPRTSRSSTGSSGRRPRAESDLSAAVEPARPARARGRADRDALEQRRAGGRLTRGRACMRGAGRRRAVAERLAEHVAARGVPREEIARRREALRGALADPADGPLGGLHQPGRAARLLPPLARRHDRLGRLRPRRRFSGFSAGHVRGRPRHARPDRLRARIRREVLRTRDDRAPRAASRGTWEGRSIAPAPPGPSAGTWSGQPVRDEER